MGILFFRARRYEGPKVRPNSWPLRRLHSLQGRRWRLGLLKRNSTPGKVFLVANELVFFYNTLDQ